jgi:HK97 family phage portal protein
LGFAWPGSSVPYEVFPTGGPWWDAYRRMRGKNTDGNSIVVAVTGWIGRTFPEAPVRVWSRKQDGDEVVYDHDLALLVESPNPGYGGPLLWMATLADFLLTGNAYWLKVRSGLGVEELWWLPSMFVEPKWDTKESYIDWYDYRPEGKENRIPVDDIVHFKHGLDPDNPRKGKSPLGAVLSEIMTDEEASLYTKTILKNLGVPGVVISPEEDMYASDEELEEIKQRFQERMSGDHRGEPLVLTRKTNVSMISFSPEQLNLRDLRRVPEERIAAVFGLPAIIAGLGAGLDRSTFANYAEAREAAYDDLIIPMQRILASTLQIQLLPDFVGGLGTRGSARARRFRVGFDLSEVRVLQEDQNKLATRLVLLLEGGAFTPNEVRAALGKPPATDWAADLRHQKGTVKPVKEEEPEPEPPPMLPGMPGVDGLLEDGGEPGEDGEAPEELPQEGEAADAAKAIVANVQRWLSDGR